MAKLVGSVLSGSPLPCHPACSLPYFRPAAQVQLPHLLAVPHAAVHQAFLAALHTPCSALPKEPTLIDISQEARALRYLHGSAPGGTAPGVVRLLDSFSLGAHYCLVTGAAWDGASGSWLLQFDAIW